MCRRLIYPALFVLALAATGSQAADLTWIRAAYFDSKYPSAWAGPGNVTRDALAAAGYTILNANELKTWMDARIADKKLSVVVMTQDVVPDTVAETQSNTCTIRRYLDTGGKVVWYADWPFYYQGKADGQMNTWGSAGASNVLGFNAATGPNDSMNIVTLTPEGITWGLTQTWQSQRPTSPTVSPNITVLAKDNAGVAAAWVKHFLPNDSFRGFVRFRDTGGQADPGDIMRVAEYIGLKAGSPDPADGAVGVNAPLLSWKPGGFAVFHDVYFGTTPDLTAANLVSSHQFFTLYYHVAGLTPGATHYWRIDEVEADGTVRTGDVWSFVAQDLKAYHPSPADKATDAPLSPVLTWLAGQGTTKHHLYFGDSNDAVSQGAAGADKGEPADPTFAPGALESLTTYYWRVDETVTGDTVRTGSVWTFTTCLSVDDFESYTDEEGGRIYETWIDGWVNGTGSTVGNTTAPFAEQKIVHNGRQSMPMDYNNINAPFYSETELDFAPTQNWTVSGVSDLSLYFRGAATNGAGTLYVAVEDSSGQVAVVTNPTAAAVKVTAWTQWKIPLSSFTGVNLAKVKKFYLGVGDRKTPAKGGTGRLYIDDIQVIKP
ncbi:MAG: hypothetical protein M1376_18060 [Planctomycetes bacterium]|nr:hypothetical protein [Planctomycetota bacterium]